MHKILYLGTDPSNFMHEGVLEHCPIIRTIPLSIPPEIKKIWPSFTHVLFTSPNAVKHWSLPLEGKVLVSIGSATADALGLPSIVAPYATQEGLIALFQSMDLSKAHILWPRSSKSRPILTNFFAENKISYCSFDLYKTETLLPDLLPDIDSFDEIVFTSPTTVSAYLEIFGLIPTSKKITPIGPVTAEALRKSIGTIGTF